MYSSRLMSAQVALMKSTSISFYVTLWKLSSSVIQCEHPPDDFWDLLSLTHWAWLDHWTWSTLFVHLVISFTLGFRGLEPYTIRRWHKNWAGIGLVAKLNHVSPVKFGPRRLAVARYIESMIHWSKGMHILALSGIPRVLINWLRKAPTLNRVE